MKVDIAKLYELEKQKLLSVQKHPEVDLLIWNYTEKAQYDRVWNEWTTQCRGLITDLEGNIMARPLKKFFNYEEVVGKDSKLPPLPIGEKTEITEKADGSLAILYWINDQPFIATRGSFVSDQAIRATQILRNKYPHVELPKDRTMIWEVIYPQNRIVIDYGGLEDLMLITAIKIETGEETSLNKLAKEFPEFPRVKIYDGLEDITKLKELEEPNKEGFVVRFESGTRVKIKFSDYIRLHRLVTGVNARAIWDLLRFHQPFDELLSRVPDEFYKWVEDTRHKLKSEYEVIETISQAIHEKVKDLPTRKDQALAIIEDQEDRGYSGIVFKMLDNKPYEDLIWKMLRPVHERPFRLDADAV